MSKTFPCPAALVKDACGLDLHSLFHLAHVPSDPYSVRAYDYAGHWATTINTDN
jgi:hypothetical protein